MYTVCLRLTSFSRLEVPLKVGVDLTGYSLQCKFWTSFWKVICLCLLWVETCKLPKKIHGIIWPTSLTCIWVKFSCFTLYKLSVRHPCSTLCFCCFVSLKVCVSECKVFLRLVDIWCPCALVQLHFISHL